MSAQQIVITRDQIAASLKLARESRGKSQRQLGREAGVLGRLICYWEKGRGEPSITAAIKIAGALGMSLSTDTCTLSADTKLQYKSDHLSCIHN